MAVETERKTVLDFLKDLLEGITELNGYQTTVAEVKRGIHLSDEMPNKPALCFWNDKALKTDQAGEKCEKALHIWMWGYVDVQPGNYDTMDALECDVEKALNSTPVENWPASVIEVDAGNITTYEGGASDPLGMFEMELVITFQYDRSQP